jgi:hypothetical protein
LPEACVLIRRDLRAPGVCGLRGIAQRLAVNHAAEIATQNPKTQAADFREVIENPQNGRFLGPRFICFVFINMCKSDTKPLLTMVVC